MNALDTLSPADQAEYEHVKNTLSDRSRGYTVRTTRKVAKAILLDGWWTWNGQFNDPIVKHIGLGVYEVSIKELEPKPLIPHERA